MSDFDKLADDLTIEKVFQTLKENGIEPIIAANAEQAKNIALEILPEGEEIMTMTSTTLDTIGLSEEINKKEGKYHPVRDKLYSMDRQTQEKEMKALGATPQWAVGSVHAITLKGQILIASASGSQLLAYAYGAANVLWIVGAQKIVKDLDQGLKRIYEHCLPLESERAKKAYGVAGSSVNKILIINQEAQEGRIKLILVKQNLGF